MKKTFIPAIEAPTQERRPAWWFAFQGQRILAHVEEISVRIPRVVDLGEFELRPTREHYLGRLAGADCRAAELPDGVIVPKGMDLWSLRELYGFVDEDLFGVAGRAAQIVHWGKTHQFCGQCGTRMEVRSSERATECPRCGLLQFPRLSPAIIVLVERGSEFLLVRARRHPTGLYSVVAGFVEPGETLEEAVAREVREESGLTIKDIRYFGSQPWPFPHSLMIGFTASYADGTICPDDDEIEDAGWFTPDRLPTIPSRISIARRLIDWFVMKQVRRSRASE